jgi:hypothetical protein
MRHKFVLVLSVVIGLASDIFCHLNDYVIAYGDAESHLNIAKRVISCLTPGLAQLGGIWLPLPHLLMVPLVTIDPLWRSGLAGTLVSGLAFVIASLIIYRLALLITESENISFMAALAFMTNPNILYLQSTPMTELPLIAFFLLNSYFFLRFIQEKKTLLPLILAGSFGFCATLSRYDGWFLVALEVGVLGLSLLSPKQPRKQVEGQLFLFATPAFYGILLWFLWSFLIFRNPFYFTNSIFSAKSQQMAWLQRNELPAYHHLGLAFSYYLVTAITNIGLVISSVAGAGILFYLLNPKIKNHLIIATVVKNHLIIATVLLAPFFFYVISLYVGQSVIFIPSLTPRTFEWQLFNVRYGVMMVPAAAIFFACFLNFFKKTPWLWLSLAILFIFFQTFLYISRQAEVITLADGVSGLSSAKKPDAQNWLREHYDQGLVLLDDYARTLSIIRTGIPMENVIYIGTAPYWEESFQEPEKYATWIIMQKDDAVWQHLYDPPEMQARLYKYFNKVYTSKEILIFKRIGT